MQAVSSSSRVASQLGLKHQLGGLGTDSRGRRLARSLNLRSSSRRTFAAVAQTLVGVPKQRQRLLHLSRARLWGEGPLAATVTAGLQGVGAGRRQQIQKGGRPGRKWTGCCGALTNENGALSNTARRSPTDTESREREREVEQMLSSLQGMVDSLEDSDLDSRTLLMDQENGGEFSFSAEELAALEGQAEEFKGELRELYTEVLRLLAGGNGADARRLVDANVQQLQEAVAEGEVGVEQAALLQVLAQLQLLLGKLDEVQPLLDQATTLLAQLDDLEPMVGDVMEGVADLYMRVEQPEAALPLMKRALKAREGQDEADKEDLAGSLVSLGHAYAGMDRPAAAAGAYARAVALLEEHYGESAPQLCLPLAALGHALLSAQRGEEAQEVLERGLAVTELADGAAAETTGVMLCSLARAKMINGYYDDAVDLFRSGVQVCLAAGMEEVHAARSEMARLLVALGREAEAQEALTENLTSLEMALGPNDGRLIVPLQELAACHGEAEQFEESLPYLRRSVALTAMHAGPSSPEASLPLALLAAALAETGELEEAETLAREVLGMREDGLGADDPMVAQACFDLAGVLHMQGKFEESEALMHRALAVAEALYGTQSPELLELLEGMHAVLQSRGKEQEARHVAARANRIRHRASAQLN